MDVYVKLVNLMLPFLIHFIFECELNVTTTYLHRVYE